MNPVNRPIRKFNPGTLQSDDEIIEQFVIRKPEFKIVRELISENIDSLSCQHILVVAPRGRGKSMLLARIGAELRTDRKLSARLLPVRFMEESQEISNISDFWLEALFSLGKECAKNNPVLAEELRVRHSTLASRWREHSIEDQARGAVLAMADRLDKKLVLIVENLQALCENVNEDFGWKLRATLQTEPQIILLASATSRFEELDNVDQPFFEFFRIIGLGPLDRDECRRLWQLVSGKTITKREIKPIQILTGGSPRLLVIGAGAAQHRSPRNLMEELVALIAEYTEYFRNHLEILAKTERRVYLAVIDLWQASRTGEIAKRARMDTRTVSTMLGRLVKRGVVVVEGHTQNRLYAANERLFSIYCRLRREPSEAAAVRNLIRFMAAFYSESGLSGLSGRMRSEAETPSAVREGIEQASAEPPNDEGIVPMVAGLGIDIRSEDAAKARKGEEDSIIRETRDNNCDVSRQRQYIPNQPLIDTLDQMLAPHTKESSQLAETEVASLLYAKAVLYEDLGDSLSKVRALEELFLRVGKCELPEVQTLVATALVKQAEALIEIGRTEEVPRVCERVERRLDFLPAAIQTAIARRSRRLWMSAGLALGQISITLDGFRSLYSGFVTSDEEDMRRILGTVLDLVVRGVPLPDLIGGLTSDTAKSDSLKPLIVALRQLNGEAVHAYPEVLDVAADIRKEINTMRARPLGLEL